MTADLHIETYGFPPGYFVIRSVACDRLVDVSMDSKADGTALVLWPEKDTSLVEIRRSPAADNQVFFIDTSGVLCSRSSGHAVDVEGDRLVLRHRRPITYPFPNSYSHPLPRFSYSAETGEITVHFTSDPAHPPPHTNPPSDAWEKKTHILVSIPLRKPRTILDDAHHFLSSAITSPLSFFSNSESTATHEAVVSTDIDLGDDEVLEEERGEEAEVDDSPDSGRPLRVLGILNKSEEERKIAQSARLRRKWKITSLRQSNARTGEGLASQGL